MTGCRVSEALALRGCDVDLESAEIRFATLKRRKEHWRAVPVDHPGSTAIKPQTRDLAGAVHGAARPVASTTSSPGRGRSRSRQGKRGILIHVDPELARRLKHLAVERDTSLQALSVEAFQRLLAGK